MTKLLWLKQNYGLLTVKGENLRINKLSIDTSEVIVEGDIVSLVYTEKNSDTHTGGGLLTKLFK